MITIHVPTGARPRQARQGGFSLIEILIAMLIAMIGVVIMTEVLIASEQRTRTTSGSNDATSNGAIMMQMIQRDLVQGGYGINSVKLMGCSFVVPTGGTVPIAPVTINPPDTLIDSTKFDANTDRIVVVMGGGTGQPEGNEVTGHVSGTPKYQVQAAGSFAVGDYVIPALNNTSCTGTLILSRVTAVAKPHITLGTNADAQAIFNIGNAPRIVAYGVRNGELVTCDFMAVDCRTIDATNWTALAGGIVSLRAQYGRDTTATIDYTVDTWDKAQPANTCAWRRVSAVRFALVARSGQYETAIDAGGQRTCEQVTPDALAPTWSGQGSADSAINLGPSGGDWQCYRYRTFETVAPARNMVWMGECS